jgi:putative FmdB family regulatory protein
LPIYEYECDTCGTHHELILSFDASDPPCPDCDMIMRRVFSTFGIKMKMPWITKMERKWGKHGHPYRDEEGKDRPGVDSSPPMMPGPRTTARQKFAKEQMEMIKEKMPKKTIVNMNKKDKKK